MWDELDYHIRVAVYGCWTLLMVASLLLGAAIALVMAIWPS